MAITRYPFLILGHVSKALTMLLIRGMKLLIGFFFDGFSEELGEMPLLHFHVRLYLGHPTRDGLTRDTAEVVSKALYALWA